MTHSLPDGRPCPRFSHAACSWCGAYLCGMNEQESSYHTLVEGPCAKAHPEKVDETDRRRVDP